MEEVEECCVVASPHPINVKEASCHIVLKEKYSNLSKYEYNLIIEKIVNEIEDKTSKMYSYYIPGTYEFSFSKLPLTSFGKVDFMKLESKNFEEFEKNGEKALRKIRYR
jgi:acyl-coenzyme A synthetase/AMP-(fatty) acid ligase